MDHYKKERSSRQHLRIDLETSLSQEEGGGLLLTNPMACGSISPGVVAPAGSATPGTLNVTASSSSSTTAASHPHTSHHHHLSSSQRTSPPNSLTQSLNYSTHGGGGGGSSTGPGNSGSLTRGVSGAGGSNERSSFGKGSKNRSKSPALLRFFVRGSGSSRKTSEVEEEDYASSGSDHEDPFSPRSVTGGVGENSRHITEPLKSPSTSVEQYATLPRQFRRYHSAGSTYILTQRDSGFSSERESISHMRDDLGMTQIVEDSHGSPTLVEAYQPAGMDALEVLQNQLQILMKQECDNEETDAANVYEEVIASLSKRIEELSLAMDSLRQSDQNLTLSLRMAEQRAMEAETKLRHFLDRNQRSEQKYLKLAIKYQALAKRHREMEKLHHRKLTPKTSKEWGLHRSPPQRVHSHNQYDRENPASLDPKRPSTAQGFHSNSNNSSQQPTNSKTTVVSLSHTQTSV